MSRPYSSLGFCTPSKRDTFGGIIPRAKGIFGSPFFDDDFISSFFDDALNLFPEGSKCYKRDIKNANGEKIGEEVVKTYSSGCNTIPTGLVDGKLPCNIYIDENYNRVYEFAVAGYKKENISLKVNEHDFSCIDLILKGDAAEVNPDDKETDDKVVAKRVYDYQKICNGDMKVTFRVDRDRFDFAHPVMSLNDGILKIVFPRHPDVSNFNPKFK